MLRSRFCAPAVSYRLRTFGLSHSKFSSVRSKKPSGKGNSRKRSAALTAIINLKGKNNVLTRNSVETLLDTHPIHSLNISELSTLIQILGKKKFKYNSSMLSQIVDVLESDKIKMTEQQMGMFSI